MYPNLEEVRVSEEKTAATKVGPVRCTDVFKEGLMRGVKDGKRFKLKSRRQWVLAGLTALFVASFIGTIVMWCTDTFDRAVLSHLILKPNNPTFDVWRKPPVKITCKIHVFNYTNVDKYEEGTDEKLRVEDIGPYSYEESLERINIRFNDDGTTSFQEKRSYRFVPELSPGRKQSDKLVVPNLPMLTAASMVKDSFYLTRVSMSTLLKTLNTRPFLHLPAHRFIFGYDDRLFDLARSAMAFQHNMPFEKFGIMAKKNGLSSDVITIYNGENGLDNFGYVRDVNGAKTIGHWSTDECNSISGTDGTMFPPKMVRNKQQLSIYQKDMCRKMPMQFEEEIKILNGIPAYKYSLPLSTFDSPENRPEHQCFCNLDSGDCPPQGIFNSTPCSFGAPAFISFPHFLNADPTVVEAIDGLRPRAEYGENYVLVHPKYGIAMSGRTSLQMNIQVRRSFGMGQLDMFDDDLVLPVAWAEMSVTEEDLPQELVDLVYMATFTVDNLEVGLRWACLLTMLVVAIVLCVVVGRNSRRGVDTRSDCSTMQLS